ncbi:FG-GAP-like repeat-containing protein [Streptomyces sp. NPDC023998]|uniref:FG-GAP-like repeat-containing protein n=1 Tax=Streptomyces sp. NPDC023998 TaxID=3154597 RepID=UPI0033EF78B9
MRKPRQAQRAGARALVTTALAGALLAGTTGAAQPAAAAEPAVPSWLVPIAMEDEADGAKRACTAIVLSTTRTLVAPDCFTGRSEKDFVWDYGSTGEIEGGTNRPDYRTHPQFNAATRLAAIGVLNQSRANPGGYGRPVLAGPADTGLYAAGSIATFFSWAAVGDPKAKRVRHAEQAVVRTSADCATALGVTGLPKGTICTGPPPGTVPPNAQEQCFGDSGGALVAGGKLIAVSATGSAACVKNGIRLYTTVPTYRALIEGWTRDVDLDHETTGSILAREPGEGIIDHLTFGPITSDPVDSTGQLFEPSANLVLQAGDLDRNGYADLLVRTTGGTLQRVPIREDTSPGKRANLGTGWNRYNKLLVVRDLTGDGQPDLLGREPSGYLWLYRGNGTGGFGSRVLIGSGWGQYNAIAGRGDLSGDAVPDLLVRDAVGDMWLYRGNGRGGFLSRTKAATGWKGFNAIVGSGDFDHDGRQDVIGRTAAGAGYLYNINGKGNFVSGKLLTSNRYKGYVALS